MHLRHDLDAIGQAQAVYRCYPARSEKYRLHPGGQATTHVPLKPFVDSLLGDIAEDGPMDPLHQLLVTHVELPVFQDL